MVCVLFADGCEEAEVIIPVDLMRRAKLEVKLAGITGETVIGAHGIEMKADCLLSRVDPDEVEMVFVPGGLGGVNNILADEACVSLLRRAAAEDKWIAAICAGPTVLTRIGLMEGKNAVCFPGMEELLAPAVAQPGADVVVDGKFITGKAAGVAFDLGLKMISVLQNPQRAEKIRSSVHYCD